MALKALILAVDGVLAETHEAHRETFNDVFKEAGVDWYWDRARYGHLLRSKGGHDMIADFVNAELPAWRYPRDLQVMLDAMRRRHATLLSERVRARKVEIRPGIRSLLEFAASAGIQFAIATQEREEDVRALLECHLSQEMVASFEILSSSACRRHGTTSAYDQAVQHLMLSPRECLAVESSAHGLRDALAAGLPVVLMWGLYPQLHDCGDVLRGNTTSLACASGVMLSRWDCMSAPDLLEHLREIHAAQVRIARPEQDIAPDPSAIQAKELDYAGFRHLDA